MWGVLGCTLEPTTLDPQAFSKKVGKAQEKDGPGPRSKYLAGTQGASVVTCWPARKAVHEMNEAQHTQLGPDSSPGGQN